MLAQYRLNQHFDNKQQFKNMYVAVLFSNIKWEEQQDNKLILLLHYVKLHCGIRDLNTLRGPEGKFYN